MTDPPSGLGRLGARVLAAGLFGGVLAGATGFALTALGSSGGRGIAEAYREFLIAGGWLKIPLACMALAAAHSAIQGLARDRWPAAMLAVALAAAAFWVVVVPASRTDAVPRTSRAKARAILKWSYQSPAAVLHIVAMSRDPEPHVRDLAVLGLGENMIVSDVEHASATRPSRWHGSPVRDSLRARLREALAGDSTVAVRAEAARALWKAPRTFGLEAAAAETLAAVLDRATHPGAAPRLAWLALDAAAGHRDATLLAAAARFAAATQDSELAQAARRALAAHGSGGTTARSAINGR